MSEQEPELTLLQLAAALEGIYAYDAGSLDSGVHDEGLRRRVYSQIEAMPADRRRAFVCALVTRMASTEAQSQGYGPEDCMNFLRWLEDEIPSAVIYLQSDFSPPTPSGESA